MWWGWWAIGIDGFQGRKERDCEDVPESEGEKKEAVLLFFQSLKEEEQIWVGARIGILKKED